MTQYVNNKQINGAAVNSNPKVKNQKSKFWAYVLWFFGGFFGLHHFYLGRDDQGILWLTSFGGYFGCGWLRDFFKIPSYVADVNNDPNFNEMFKIKIRTNAKPPFSMTRFLGAFLTSLVWGTILYTAIPEEEIYGINFKHLYILIPLVVALGTWTVGNIGREKGTIWHCLIASYIGYPTLTYFGDDEMWIVIMALLSACAFDSFSKKWRLTPKKQHSLKRRILFITFFSTIFVLSLMSYFYFNAIIIDDGEEIKLSEAMKHFFTSPIWVDLKASLQHMWAYAQHQGFWGIWKELTSLSDPRGEINAFKVLGLSQTSSQSEVTAKWRALSREHHPDKIKGSEEERKAAHEKFIKIQQAYEILSSAKSRRQKRSRKSS